MPINFWLRPGLDILSIGLLPHLGCLAPRLLLWLSLALGLCCVLSVNGKVCICDCRVGYTNCAVMVQVTSYTSAERGGRNTSSSWETPTNLVCSTSPRNQNRQMTYHEVVILVLLYAAIQLLNVAYFLIRLYIVYFLNNTCVQVFFDKYKYIYE